MRAAAYPPSPQSGYHHRPPAKESGDRAEFLSDGVINLYNLRKNRQHYRGIEVMKMRDTRRSHEAKLFGICGSGLKILDDPKEGES